MASFVSRLTAAVIRRAKLIRDKRIVKESELFNGEWYLKRYPDIRKAGLDPLSHYLTLGYKEGREPSLNFSSSWYMDVYPDIHATGVNPLVHYLRFGIRESRSPLRPVSGERASKACSPLPTESVEITLRTAAVVHLFYPDLATELLDACSHIPNDPHLFVAATSQDGKQAAEAWAKKRNWSNLTVEIMPNRGRNVSSWTAVFGPQLLETSDVFCHIHSKKSLHMGFEHGPWRRHNLECLLGNPSQILTLFETMPDLGAIGPVPHPSIPYYGFTWLSNKEPAEALAKKLEVNIHPDGYLDFPAGNMFWGRTKALRQMLDGRIKIDDFPAESGQVDGTIAHAIERMVYYLAEENGFQWAEVDTEHSYLNWCHKNLWQYVIHATEAHFKKELGRCNTVSFDLFGTLLARKLPWSSDIATVATAAGKPAVVVERENQVPRKRIMEAFEAALAEKKRVLVVGTTPYSKSDLEPILKDFGLDRAHAVYFSPDPKKLWEELAAKEDALSEEYVHICHDEFADLGIGGAMGVRCFHVMSATNLFLLSEMAEDLPRSSIRHGEIPLDLGSAIAERFNDPMETGGLL
jgi:hypothetical protein